MSDKEQHSPNSEPEDVTTQPVPPPTHAPGKYWLVGLIFLLAAWIGSISIGTVIFGQESQALDWRKPALVLLPMVVFLTVWIVLLARRKNGPS